MNGEDAHKLLREIRMDLTAAQAKITDLGKLLGELQLEDRPRPRCPHCGLSFRFNALLAEHVYVTHDGPVPNHYLTAEALTEGGDAQ